MQKYENKFDTNKVDYELQKNLWNKFSKLPSSRFESIQEFRKTDNRICNSFIINNKNLFDL